MLAIYTGKGESQGKYISHMLPPSMNKAAHFKTHRKHKQKSNTEVLISGHQHLKKTTLVTLWLCVLNIIPHASFHGINFSSQIVHIHPNQYTSTFWSTSYLLNKVNIMKLSVIVFRQHLEKGEKRCTNCDLENDIYRSMENKLWPNLV